MIQIYICILFTLLRRHNGHGSVSNHQPHDCLLSRLFRRRSKKASTLHFTGLCAGNSPGPGEFPAQMASNVENVSIWWRCHDTLRLLDEISVVFILLHKKHMHVVFAIWVNSIEQNILLLCLTKKSPTVVTWFDLLQIWHAYFQETVCGILKFELVMTENK